jgi:hypothetical protein
MLIVTIKVSVLLILVFLPPDVLIRQSTAMITTLVLLIHAISPLDVITTIFQIPVNMMINALLITAILPVVAYLIP